MQTPFLWLVLSGPAAFAMLALAGSRAGRDAGHAAIVVAAFTLACAAAAGAAVALSGDWSTPLLGAVGIGFSLYLDALSAAMFGLVSFIGLIVVRYSRHYLAGDPAQDRFIRQLCLTLAAVLTLIVAGNLFLFAFAWVATSLGLHGLLTFYRDRPAALLAARKKFIASRLGDACLLGAMGCVYAQIGSLDYAAIEAGVAAHLAGGNGDSRLPLAALLLAGAALLKSAQFPLHGWLLEVMETPTPVSALLHAGIINAGGFLVLRFAHLISVDGAALELLALMGGFTALFGSVVMLTQTSIKVALAYSTIAQMGFMMLQCGLGAFSAALLHIVAHSLYKAHAFLSSGSVIDVHRAAWAPTPGGQPHPARIAVALVVVIGLSALIGAQFGATLTAKPGVLALGTVVALGLVQLVANAIDERPSMFVIARTVACACGVAALWFALQWGTESLFADALPATAPLRGWLDVVIVALVVLSFSALSLFQSLLPQQAETPRWQALRVHVANGFYVNAVANRLIQRYWPVRPAATRVSRFNSLVSPGVQS
jgi:NAD(P)H-quinone oxidoreductase subunit 5